ncbi:MAG: enoyl-CoA hydratase/isomerase family protein [Xanthomonadaceae bacterium]|nr:enoyl-CoA hydratase/isomerase family protein [Xanthomonadaceae bacterium]
MNAVLSSLSSRGVLTLTLNRPDRHNALNPGLLTALHAALLDAERDSQVRTIVLTGAGASFCAGADIEHMRSTRDLSEEANLEDARLLAQCLRALDEVDRPLIARVNGNAFGGGIGLIACADVAIGTMTAKFALTEVRLGLVPATISPYVIRAIGTRQARRLFLTAARFEAPEARAIGLLHDTVAASQLDETVEAYLESLLQGGPNALREAKRLIRIVEEASDREMLLEETSRLLAKLRAGGEAKEGLSAFLEKRKAGWTAK